MNKLILLLITALTLAINTIAAVPISNDTMIVTPDGISISKQEFEECTKVLMLEAGGEPEECQRAVCEVIYNRLRSGVWGDNLHDVLFAENQFSVIPYIDTAKPTKEVIEVVRDVFTNGSTLNKKILFFRPEHYHRWYGAVDEFQIGKVYFSSSIWITMD